MNKKKIIIILLSALCIIGIGLIVVILFVNKTPDNNNQAQPGIYNQYQVSLTENKGDVKVVLTANNQNYQLDQISALKYIISYVNSTQDNLSALCPLGYIYLNPSSSTGNVVKEVPILSEVDISLNKNKPNNLTLTCSKAISDNNQ